MSGTWTERQGAWRDRYGEDDAADWSGLVGAAVVVLAGVILAGGTVGGLVQLGRWLARR